MKNRGVVKAWLKNGNYHREDGHAVEYDDGVRKWYRDGHLHRENGPAVEYPDGTVAWYHTGVLHRENGPAMVSCDGIERWYSMGRIHRSDGPAHCNPRMNDYRWFFQGTQYTFLEWSRILNKPPSEITELVIQYGIRG